MDNYYYINLKKISNLSNYKDNEKKNKNCLIDKS